MKRGTLLLALALLLHGSAALGVFDGAQTMSKKERRLAKKVAKEKRRKARAAADAAVAAIEVDHTTAADGKTAFAITFGPATKPAEYVSAEEDPGKSDDDLTASVRGQVDAAMATPAEAADGKVAEADNSQASDDEKDTQAATGWFDTLLGRAALEPTQEELEAQAVAELKAQQEKSAEGFKQWIQAPNGYKLRV